MMHVSFLQKSRSIIAMALMVLLLGVNMVSAADVTYSADTTVTVNSLNLTIDSGSLAAQMIIGATTLTITTGSSQQVTVRSSDKYTMSSSPTLPLICTESGSRMVIPSSTTAVITPTSTVCTIPPQGNGSAVSPAAAVPATPATPAVPAVTPAIPAVPATPATTIVTDLPAIKGAVEVQEVVVPTNGKVAARTNLVNVVGDVSIDLSRNVKLSGLKADQVLQAPVETDPATVSTLKASTLKKKSVVAAYDLDTDAVKSNKTVKMQVALGAMTDTKGLKAYLLDETTGKTKTLLGSYNKKTNVFTARTKYLGGYTLVFTLPAPVVKK